MKIIYLTFLFISLNLLVGCTRYSYFRFEPVTLALSEGVVTVSVEGMYGKKYQRNGESRVDWGEPYDIKILLTYPLHADLYGLRVTELAVKGLESGFLLNLPDPLVTRFIDPNVERTSKLGHKKIIARVSSLSSSVLLYENLKVEGVIIINPESKDSVEERISVVLKTNYKETARLAWFERFMSI